MKRFCLFLAALLVSAGLHAGEPGIPTGVYFALPVVNSAGKTVKAKACIDAAHVLHVYYVEGDDVGMLDYAITRNSGPTPPNPPNPPDPPNPPTPSTVSYIYVIRESADLTPAVAAVELDKVWKDACDARGIRWAIFDPDEGKKRLPTVTAKAIAAGLPAVAVLDKNNAATIEPLPKTPIGMMDLLRKYGGIK